MKRKEHSPSRCADWKGNIAYLDSAKPFPNGIEGAKIKSQAIPTKKEQQASVPGAGVDHGPCVALIFALLRPPQTIMSPSVGCAKGHTVEPCGHTRCSIGLDATESHLNARLKMLPRRCFAVLYGLTVDCNTYTHSTKDSTISDLLQVGFLVSTVADPYVICGRSQPASTSWNLEPVSGAEHPPDYGSIRTDTSSAHQVSASTVLYTL
ncbi:uncharacterized protein UTRI_06510 [Ustilago trichophora]|uniref:Uncharacterized protein n=1 Tax=Ustilago trichophora TaxID=86804 RepID=A0A5C3EMU4_9BASI|nr:uncharacterized protein UTRI_06510 [Ustilago trichophora]